MIVENIEICTVCGKELDEYEIFNYDNVCENCMKKWELENQMLLAEYYKKLL